MAMGAGKYYLGRIAKGFMPKRGLEWPLPQHSTSLASDPFEAVSKRRVLSKTTFSLLDLEADDLPDPVHEDVMDPLEEEDPFDLGPLGFDSSQPYPYYPSRPTAATTGGFAHKVGRVLFDRQRWNKSDVGLPPWMTSEKLFA